MLATFPSAIIDAHGRDLTISNDPSRTGTPAPTSTTQSGPPVVSAVAAASQTASAPVNRKADTAKVNSTTVVVEADFHAAADDLFSLLTDEKRIPIWTRAPAQVCFFFRTAFMINADSECLWNQSQPQPGSQYSLFGGGVKGKYITLTPGKEIVQTWSLQSPTWPSGIYYLNISIPVVKLSTTIFRLTSKGHEAKLTTTLAQASDSTKVTFSLDGVPTGLEAEIKRNIEGY